MRFSGSEHSAIIQPLPPVLRAHSFHGLFLLTVTEVVQLPTRLLSKRRLPQADKTVGHNLSPCGLR